MRPTARASGSVSSFAMTNPSMGFTKYWAKYPTRMGAGLAMHFLKSLTVRVSPIASMRKPSPTVNMVEENHVTAEGFAIPSVAPINTHKGNSVASLSASFSIAVCPSGRSAETLPASALHEITRA
jgi:hypothetical protein